jgi:hypothetical protein
MELAFNPETLFTAVTAVARAAAGKETVPIPHLLLEASKDGLVILPVRTQQGRLRKSYLGARTLPIFV